MFLAGVPKTVSIRLRIHALLVSLVATDFELLLRTLFHPTKQNLEDVMENMIHMCILYHSYLLYVCIYIYILYVCVCVFFKVFDGYHECSCILVAIDNNMNLNWLLETYTWCIRCWKDMKEYFRIIRNTMYMFNVQYYLMHCLYNEQTNGTWDQKWENRCQGPTVSAWNNVNSAVRFSPRVTADHGFQKSSDQRLSQT